MKTFLVVPFSVRRATPERVARYRADVLWRFVALCLFFFAAGVAPGAAESKARYFEALVDFQRYAENTWKTAGYSNAPANSGYWGDGISTGNAGIRGNCGVAVAYAVLVKADPSSPERPARLEKIARALNYAANTHASATNVCVDGKQWGYGWQSALWAGSMGLACLLVENELPPQTIAAVKKALASEATYRAGIAPASGYVGDTKAEENGWNSNALALAAAWLSADPKGGDWLLAAKRYLANTYTVANTAGDPMAPWITTTTLYPDFSLENHGFYHPTYQMVAGMSMGDSLLMARLCNPAVAAELKPFAEHNVLQVWTNLNNLVLDSGEFAYPSGLDWELHDFEKKSYIAWLATHFNDPLATWSDEKLSQLVRYRQIVNGDGRFVGESMNNGFFREAVEVRRAAIAWLHHDAAVLPAVTGAPPGPAVHHYPYVKIVSHRDAFGFASVSYGSKIAVMVEPPALSIPTNAFMTSPLVPGIMGLGLLGNPTSASLTKLETNESGFQAALVVTNGSQGKTEVYIVSNGRTVGIVEVPYPAAALAGEAASFTTGIENHPLTGGRRVVEWTGALATFTNRTGVSRNITNRWVCVDSRYGLAAGPAGYFRYQTASSYNRPGAAEDRLSFFSAEPLAARYAVWFPGQNPQQTATLAAQVRWITTGTNFILEIPGPDDTVSRIETLPLPPEPLHPLYRVPAAVITASSTQSPIYPPENANDDNLGTFWVSLYGPTNSTPQWLLSSFDRPLAASELKVFPRTLNGGYGPADVEIWVNVTNLQHSLAGTGTGAGSRVFEGRMQPTTALQLKFEQPLIITNALLIARSGYDRGVISSATRNAQVVEFAAYERGLPGAIEPWVYWQIFHFDDREMADERISGEFADPDADGLCNLLEFAFGTKPRLPEIEPGRLQVRTAGAGKFALSHPARSDLAGLRLDYEVSRDLLEWQIVTPLEVKSTSSTETTTREVVFEAGEETGFYRVRVKRET